MLILKTKRDANILIKSSTASIKPITITVYVSSLYLKYKVIDMWFERFIIFAFSKAFPSPKF